MELFVIYKQTFRSWDFASVFNMYNFSCGGGRRCRVIRSVCLHLVANFESLTDSAHNPHRLTLKNK